MNECAFEGNIGSSSDQSFGSGGGLSQSGGSGNVSNSIFIANTVRALMQIELSHQSFGLGGGLSQQGGSGNVSDSIVIANMLLCMSDAGLCTDVAVGTAIKGITPWSRCPASAGLAVLMLNLACDCCAVAQPGGRPVPEQPHRRRQLLHLCRQQGHGGLLRPGAPSAAAPICCRPFLLPGLLLSRPPKAAALHW